MKTNIGAIGTSATKRRWISYYCRAYVFTLAYNARSCSTAVMQVTNRPDENLDKKWLIIKYVYRQVHATTTLWGCSVMTVNYGRLMKHKRICVRTSAVMLNYMSQRLWRMRATTRYGPNSKSCFHHLIEDEDQLLRAHDALSVSSRSHGWTLTSLNSD